MKKTKSNSFFNRKNAKKSIIGCVSVVLSLSFAALGTSLYRFYNPVNTVSYTSEMAKNKAEVDDFINNFKYKDKKIVSSENFEGSIKVVDKNKKEIKDFRNKTVLEFYQEGAFEFVVPEIINYWSKQKGIDISFESYNKNNGFYSAIPNESNSTYPNFYVCFSKGNGKDKYLRRYNIGSNNLYGFKKTSNQVNLENYINKFDSSNIELDKEFYVNDDPTQQLKSTSFAKTVKISNIRLKNVPSGINYSVQNTFQDKENPRILKIVFEFTIGKSYKTKFRDSYHEVNFPLDFPVDLGVDDPKSKVDIFLSDIQNSQNFNESLSVVSKKSSSSSSSDEKETITTANKYLEEVKQNYEFQFSPSSSKVNLASSSGLKYFIKPNEKDFIRTNYDDPSSYMFKVYIGTSIEATNFYEKSFYTATDLKFKQSQNKKIALKLQEKLTQSNSDKPTHKIDLSINANFEPLKTANSISEDIIRREFEKWSKDKELNELVYTNTTLANSSNPFILALTIPPLSPAATNNEKIEIDASKISVQINKFRTKNIEGKEKIILELYVYYGDLNSDAYRFKKDIILNVGNKTVLTDDALSNKINISLIKEIKQNKAKLSFNYPISSSPIESIEQILETDQKIVLLYKYLESQVFYDLTNATTSSITKQVSDYFGMPTISLSSNSEKLIGVDSKLNQAKTEITISGIQLVVNNNWKGIIKEDITLVIGLNAQHKVVVKAIQFIHELPIPK